MGVIKLVNIIVIIPALPRIVFFGSADKSIICTEMIIKFIQIFFTHVLESLIYLAPWYVLFP